jgi:hypothetical protein
MYDSYFEGLQFSEGKWFVSMTVEEERINLGPFESFEQAWMMKEKKKTDPGSSVQEKEVVHGVTNLNFKIWKKYFVSKFFFQLYEKKKKEFSSP